SATAIAFSVVAWAVPFWLIASGGHAGGTDTHTIAVSALLLHLVFVSIWLGGLLHVALLTGSRRPAEPLDASAQGLRPDAEPGVVLLRYSTLALVSVAVVAFPGVMSALVRMGTDLTSDYGVLVIAKTVLLVVLGGIGAWQRMR
ncbi:hypothetical protein FV292_26765, partial [Escherichia coli]